MVVFKTCHKSGKDVRRASSLKNTDSSTVSTSDSLFCRHWTHSDLVNADKSSTNAASRSASLTISREKAVRRDKDPKEATSGPEKAR